MNAAFYQPAAGRARPPDLAVSWREELPAPLRAVVVAPVRFEVLQDYEMAADRTLGYDKHHAPCFCAYRYALTRLRSDDDEVFYEAPVYTQTVTSWRLPDARWLVCHTTRGNLDRGEFHSRLFLSDAMPR
jgi:hypothetical protein